MLTQKDYFEAEMRTLQELAQEFSDAYPEQAAMLNLNAVKDRDPYVERLLEGMAFLSSQIRTRLDDSVPEISEALLDQLLPTLIRPYPSTTVVQFQGHLQNREKVAIPAQQKVSAQNVGPANAQCPFITTHPVDVLPLSVQSVRSEEKAGGGCRISLTFQLSPQVALGDLELSKLKFYIKADWPLAYALFYALTHRQNRLSLEANGRNLAAGPSVSMQPEHLQPRDGLLPTDGRGRAAFSLMHDYFCAREKYLFVSLAGLETVNWPETTPSFTVTIDSSVDLPVDTQVTAEHLLLNCTPAVNLFVDDAEPITLDHQQAEYRLLPERQNAEHTSVYSVTSVQGRDQATGESFEYSPLHAMQLRKANDRVYYAKVRKAGVDKRFTYLAFNAPPPYNRETISSEARMTNEQVPRRYIEIGGINRIHEEFSRQVTPKNVLRPSKMLQAPNYQDVHWQLVSLMSLNLSSLASADHLQQLLSLFDWSEQADNARRIEAISDVQVKTTHRLRKGVLFQGLEIQVELAESGFSSRADAYLFGLVLHRFFSGFANMTEFVQTRIVQLPSYKEWVWNPIFGNKALF